MPGRTRSGAHWGHWGFVEGGTGTPSSWKLVKICQAVAVLQLFAVPGCSCSEPPARILPSVWVQGAPPGAAQLQGLTLQVLAPKSSSPLQAQQHIPKARADATSSPLAPKLRHAWWLPQRAL